MSDVDPKLPTPKHGTHPRWSALALGLAALGAAGLMAPGCRSEPAMSPKVATVPSAAVQPAKPKIRGVTDGEIKLGMVASFSGSNKERGRAMKLGWEAALATVNEAGGVNGRKLRLITADDGYDPARTGPAMKQMVEGEEVFAIVGNVGTATAAVAVPYCAEQKVLFFGPLSGADLLRKTPPDHWVFNVRASLAEEAAASVRWLTEVKRIAPEKIAVVAQEDDFGESGWRGAARELERLGVPLRQDRQGRLPAQHRRRPRRHRRGEAAQRQARRRDPGGHLPAGRHLHPQGARPETGTAVRGGVGRLQRPVAGGGRVGRPLRRARHRHPGGAGADQQGDRHHQVPGRARQGRPRRGARLHHPGGLAGRADLPRRPAARRGGPGRREAGPNARGDRRPRPGDRRHHGLRARRPPGHEEGLGLAAQDPTARTIRSTSTEEAPWDEPTTAAGPGGAGWRRRSRWRWRPRRRPR